MLWSQSIWIRFSILIRSTIIIIVKLNHRLCIILTAHHMITLELDMNYVYYTKSIRTTNVIQNFEFMLCLIKIFRYVYNAWNLVLKWTF